MNAKDILTYGHQDLLKVFSDVTDTDWDRVGVTTRWSVKDMLSHLTSFEIVLAEALEAVLDASMATPTLEDKRKDLPGFNDRQVAQRESDRPADVMQEYELAHTRVMQAIEQLGAERLREVGTIPWYGPQYSLDDLIVYTNYAHKREHLPQIRKFIQGRQSK